MFGSRLKSLQAQARVIPARGAVTGVRCSTSRLAFSSLVKGHQGRRTCARKQNPQTFGFHGPSSSRRLAVCPGGLFLEDTDAAEAVVAMVEQPAGGDVAQLAEGLDD